MDDSATGRGRCKAEEAAPGSAQTPEVDDSQEHGGTKKTMCEASATLVAWLRSAEKNPVKAAITMPSQIPTAPGDAGTTSPRVPAPTRKKAPTGGRFIWKAMSRPALRQP